MSWDFCDLWLSYIWGLFPQEFKGTQKAECRRIDAFELWCWKRLLRVPCTARRSNQSILKEITPEYSLEGLMLKLKLQYFGHLMWRADSLEKTLMLGKVEGRRRRGQQRIRITDLMDKSWVNSGSWWWTGRPGMLQSMGSQRVWHDWATKLNWTDGRRDVGVRCSLLGGSCVVLLCFTLGCGEEGRIFCVFSSSYQDVSLIRSRHHSWNLS